MKTYISNGTVAEAIQVNELGRINGTSCNMSYEPGDYLVRHRNTGIIEVIKQQQFEATFEVYTNVG